MTDEEYERLKADEKRHLREKKALREQARRLRRAQKTQEAAESIARAQDELDENDALTRVLREEAARGEARLALALGTDDPHEEAERPDPKARARALVRRLRREARTETSADASSDTSWGGPSDDDRPDKTIGRAR